MIMLAFDTLLYAVLTFYFDNVIPSTCETKKIFLLQQRFASLLRFYQVLKILLNLFAKDLDFAFADHHGLRRPPWFCLTPSYWCNKKGGGDSQSNLMMQENGEVAHHLDNPNVEPVPPETRARDALR